MVIHWICDHKFEYTKVSDLASRWMLVKLLGYNVAYCCWSGKEFFNPFFLLKESSRLQPFNLKGVHLMAKNLAAWRIFHSLSLLAYCLLSPTLFNTVSFPTHQQNRQQLFTHSPNYLFSLTVNVTRFGEISPLVQHFKATWTIFGAVDFVFCRIVCLRESNLL